MMQVCLRRGVQCGLRRTLRVRCLSAVPAPKIDSESGVAAVPDHVLSLADQICGLSLHETGQLTKVLKERLGELEYRFGRVLNNCYSLVHCNFNFKMWSRKNDTFHNGIVFSIIDYSKSIGSPTINVMSALINRTGFLTSHLIFLASYITLFVSQPAFLVNNVFEYNLVRGRRAL